MREWYQINAKGNRKAEILIYEQIGKSWWDDSGVGAKDFMEKLSNLDVDDIDLRINSLGGSVFEGNAIYNGLKNHKAKVHVKIDGIAASIASVIAMAGDDIEIPENGMMMIHDPWTFAGGNAEEMRRAADMLDKIKVGIVAAYRGKTGKDDAEIGDLMSAETWMTATEAVAMGFADTMLAPVTIENSFNSDTLAKFKNVPESLKPSRPAGVNNSLKVTNMSENTTKAPEITLDLIKEKYPEIANKLREEGMATGKTEGAAAERDRIVGVKAQCVPGHEALIESLAYDGKTTPAEAAMQVIAAEKVVKNAAAEAFKSSAPAVVPVVNSDNPETLTGDDKLKAEWDKNPNLRAEFAGKFELYAAHQKDIPGVKVKNQKRGGE